MNDHVRNVEVGLRDGLQGHATLKRWLLANTAANLPELISFRTWAIRELADSGLSTIEAGSFVHPEQVPLMQGSDIVLANLGDLKNIRLPVILPNVRGFENAMKAGAKEVAFFMSASEKYSWDNTRCSIAQSIGRFDQIVEANKAHNVPIRFYLSCIDGYHEAGDTPIEDVVRYTKYALNNGCYEVSLGSTYALANPEDISRIMEALVKGGVPIDKIAAHFHDDPEKQNGIPNVRAFLKAGGRIVDSSVSGIGGAITREDSPGNVSTQDVIHLCREMDLETDVHDFGKLARTGARIVRYINNPPEIGFKPDELVL